MRPRMNYVGMRLVRTHYRFIQTTSSSY